VSRGLAVPVALYLLSAAHLPFPRAFGANCNAAQASLHQSESDRAPKIYDWSPASDQLNPNRTANRHFARAVILALWFQNGYTLAPSYNQDDLQDASEYTPAAAGDMPQFALPAAAWLAALQRYRELAVNDPNEYNPLVAMALTNLGDVYKKASQLPEAEEAFNEALTIDRNLADGSPVVYKPDIAMILVKLGDLYSSTGLPDEAVKAYGEARSIYSELASSDPTYSNQVEPLTKRLTELNAKPSTDHEAGAEVEPAELP
jgi:tetratricopeptide (TPR) repeat protein